MRCEIPAFFKQIAANGMSNASLLSLWRSTTFRGSAANAFYNTMEYVSQPALMIVCAPFLVSHLGLELYGIWMLVSALAGTVGVFHIGLGDATIKCVSACRGKGDIEGVGRMIRGTLTLSLFLGGLTAITVFLIAPYFVRHVFKIAPHNASVAATAMQLGGLLLWIQSVFSVFSNSLKAHEEFGVPVKITIALKTGIMGLAVVLVMMGHGVVAIMLATLGGTLIGTACLGLAIHRLMPTCSLLPTFDRHAWREVLHFGWYSWIQNTAGVAFSQADRLLIAALLGAGPLAYYTLCIQIAQQIHALPSAAFGFLFPHISAKQASGHNRDIKRVYHLSVIANIIVSIALALPLVLLSKRILTVWMGADFAAHAHRLLSILAVAFCVLSVNVAPHFTLLGLGKVRFVSFVNVAGGIFSLAGAAILINPLGLAGAAIGRLLYGPAISANYIKVERIL